MDHEAAQHKHTRAVAFVRWQLASEKYNAITRAHADAAADALEVSKAAEEVRRRHAEWMAFVPAAPNGRAGGARPGNCSDARHL